MNLKFLILSLSPTMTEGNLTKWFIKKGDKIKAGDLIAEVETDKAVMEVEAVDEGIVKELLFKEGNDSIAVNTPITILSSEDSESSSKNDIKDSIGIERRTSSDVDLNNDLNIMVGIK